MELHNFVVFVKDLSIEYILSYMKNNKYFSTDSHVVFLQSTSTAHFSNIYILLQEPDVYDGKPRAQVPMCTWNTNEEKIVCKLKLDQLIEALMVDIVSS